MSFSCEKARNQNESQVALVNNSQRCLFFQLICMWHAASGMWQVQAQVHYYVMWQAICNLCNNCIVILLVALTKRGKIVATLHHFSVIFVFSTCCW